MRIVYANCSILTSEGIFRKTKVSLSTAKKLIILADEITSAIGHESTAQIMTTLLNDYCRVNRIKYEQKSGDVMLVFQLRDRPSEGKILSIDEIEEIGYDFFTIKMFDSNECIYQETIEHAPDEFTTIHMYPHTYPDNGFLICSTFYLSGHAGSENREFISYEEGINLMYKKHIRDKKIYYTLYKDSQRLKTVYEGIPESGEIETPKKFWHLYQLNEGGSIYINTEPDLLGGHQMDNVVLSLGKLKMGFEKKYPLLANLTE